MTSHTWSRARVSLAGTLAIILECAGTIARAEALNIDTKSDFHLFHPTPEERLRELSADRPDKTESPYTVDAGHFQIEMDAANYTYDRETGDGADVVRESLSVAPVNIKAGMLNNVDFQLMFEPFIHERTKDRITGTAKNKWGFGDVVPRIKVNLWGNDEGRTALAVMPFVKLPTNQDDLGNDALEGGIIFPFAADLPFGLGLGVMTEFDFNEDANGSGYHTEFVNSITLNRDLFGGLAGYVEFFSQVSNDPSAEWIGTADFGLAYSINSNLRLDAGINIGVTEAADDLNPFVGLTVRF